MKQIAIVMVVLAIFAGLSFSAAPIAENVTLNSTFGTNLTDENLTLYWDTYDADSDPVISFVEWLKDSALVYDYSSDVLQPELYSNLYLPFNGSATDYSPYSNSVTVTGATYTATGGHDGSGAYDFDGTNDNMTIAHDASLAPGTITVAAWIKPAQGSVAGTHFPILRKDANNWNAVAAGYLFSHTGTGLSVYLNNNSDPTWDCSVGISSSLNASEWYHAAFTFDGSDIRVYLNGEEGNSLSCSGTIQIQ